MIEWLRLTGLLNYNPVAGTLTWKVKHGWKLKGEVVNKAKMTIDGTLYSCGELAWFYTYGRWPGKDFSHINNDRLDIKLENLTNKRIFKRVKLPKKRLSCTVEKINGEYQVYGVLGRVTSDLGAFERYDDACYVQQVWLSSPCLK